MPFRLLALVLVCALAVTLVTPQEADALEPWMMYALITTGIGIIVVVVFLVVANMHESQKLGAARHDIVANLDAKPSVASGDSATAGATASAGGAGPANGSPQYVACLETDGQRHACWQAGTAAEAVAGVAAAAQTP